MTEEKVKTKWFRRVASDKSVLELARERIAHVYDLYDHICVMFSGGKDSTVCFHLTLEEAIKRGRLPLDVVHFDEEAIPYETEQYVRRVVQTYGDQINLRWYCLPIVHRNACSRDEPHWYPWDPRIPEKWCRPMPPEAITSIPGYHFNPHTMEGCREIPELNGVLFDPGTCGTVGLIMGIRAAESITRYRAVIRKLNENYIIKDAGKVWSDGGGKLNTGSVVWKVYPIYDWQTDDVWTAPKLLGWDYNRAYDLMEMQGMTHHAQRCAPPWGEEPMRGLYTFKTCFPDLWEKMVDRVPGSATAARYSRTVLYSYGGLPEKPQGMTWEAFVVEQLKRWPPAERKQVADRVRMYIRRHYTKTDLPLLGTVPHPDSGISWQFILMIAVRGDFKDRKSPGYDLTGEGAKRYAEALERFRKGEDV